ncbi:MAG: hypothetical protein ACM3O9_08390 [Methylocystaceae bacterium]
MLNCVIEGKAAEILSLSADQLEGYIASEETIDHYCELFIRLGNQAKSFGRPQTSGYKAYVLAQQ